MWWWCRNFGWRWPSWQNKPCKKAGFSLRKKNLPGCSILGWTRQALHCQNGEARAAAPASPHDAFGTSPFFPYKKCFQITK